MVAKTILIADGGSTKTDWSIVSGNREIDRIRTGGINPFFQTEEEISAEIRDNLIPRIRESDSVGAVYFYGAGCAFPEKNEIIRRSVTRYLPVPVEVGSDLLAAARALCGDSPGIACILGTGSNSKNEIIRRSVTRYLPVPVEVGSDLLAAARALCGDSPGIACILGTGSNSCLYDGKGIVKSISPLGFVLGVCMTERVLSRAYLRWALSWVMRGVAPYLENCWLGMC